VSIYATIFSLGGLPADDCDWPYDTNVDFMDEGGPRTGWFAVDAVTRGYPPFLRVALSDTSVLDPMPEIGLDARQARQLRDVLTEWLGTLEEQL
jgi:hypothetical protein